MAEIDLSLYYLNIFGTPSPTFQPEIKPVLGIKKPNRLEQSALGKNYYGVLPDGREYFMPITINWQPTDNNQIGLLSPSQHAYNNIELFYCVISAHCKKRVIRTPLTDRRGSAVEIINIDDIEFELKGFLISSTKDYPENDVTALRNLFESTQPIQLNNAKSEIFLNRPNRQGSANCIIVDADFPDNIGVPNIQPFHLKLVSVEEFNLVDIT